MIEIKNLRNQKPLYDWDVKVDRSSILGNPFHMYKEIERESVCNNYAEYFQEQMLNNSKFIAEILRLRQLYQTHGKLNLFCWCTPKRCHAETIKNEILKSL